MASVSSHPIPSIPEWTENKQPLSLAEIIKAFKDAETYFGCRCSLKDFDNIPHQKITEEFVKPFIQNTIVSLQRQFPEKQQHAVQIILQQAQIAVLDICSTVMDLPDFAMVLSRLKATTSLDIIIKAFLQSIEEDITRSLVYFLEDIDKFRTASVKTTAEYGEQIGLVFKQLWKKDNPFNTSFELSIPPSTDPLDTMLDQLFVGYNKNEILNRASCFTNQIDPENPKSDFEERIAIASNTFMQVIPKEICLPEFPKVFNQITGIVYAMSGVATTNEFQERSLRIKKAMEKITAEDKVERQAQEIEALEALIIYNPATSQEVRRLANKVFAKIRQDDKAFEEFKKELDLVNRQILSTVKDPLQKISSDFNNWLKQEYKKRQNPSFLAIATASIVGMMESCMKDERAKSEPVVLTAFDEAIKLYRGSPFDGIQQLVANVRSAENSTDGQIEEALRLQHREKHMKLMNALQLPPSDPAVEELIETITDPTILKD